MFSNQVDESTANGGGNENVLVASGRLFRNLALSVAASFEEAGFFGHQWCAHRFRWPGIFPSLSVSCLPTRRGGCVLCRHRTGGPRGQAMTGPSSSVPPFPNIGPPHTCSR